MFGYPFQRIRNNFGFLKLILSIFNDVYLLIFRINSCLEVRIDSERSINFLLFNRITFRGITKYRLLYLKINFNQINFNKINSI